MLYETDGGPPSGRRSLRAPGVVAGLVGSALLSAVIFDLQRGGPNGYLTPSNTKVWLTSLLIPWVLTVGIGALAVQPRRRIGYVVGGAVAGFGVLVLAIEVAGAVGGRMLGGDGFVGGDRLALRVQNLSPYYLHNAATLSGEEVVRYACGAAIFGAVFGLLVVLVVTGFDRSWTPALGGAFAGALLLGPQPLVTRAVKHQYALSHGAVGAIVLLGIAAIAAALDPAVPATADHTRRAGPAPVRATGHPGSPAGAPHYMPTNAFAVVSLVLGLLGGNLLAVIFGHVARGQMRRTGERGDGMAIAGLVLGYIGIALWAVLFAVALSNA